MSTSRDASFDASSGGDDGPLVTSDAEGGGEVQDADGTTDAIADQSVGEAIDSGASDASTRDWGPIPTPYGCVFPGGCSDFRA